MILPDLKVEQQLWQQNFRWVAGIDEVGRGSWAGPVVAAAVIISSDIGSDPNQWIALGIRDSKTLSPRQRQLAKDAINEHPAFSAGIGQTSVAEIADLGIAQATFLAMSRALSQLEQPPDHVLIDGFAHPDLALPQKAIIKGDATSLSIAAASIVAKEYRDNLMRQLSKELPQYGFDRHVGYGTALHRQAIARYGLSPSHRRNFHLKFLDG
jgi:ribonuclease HII